MEIIIVYEAQAMGSAVLRFVVIWMGEEKTPLARVEASIDKSVHISAFKIIAAI